MSYRDIEELMKERGIKVDHSTVNRWVIKYTPLLETEIRKRKNAVGSSWRMDETYIKVRGKWHYLYRAVDKENRTIDFLLTKKSDKKSAKRFFVKAISNNGLPEKATSIKAVPTFQQSKPTMPRIIQILKYVRLNISTTLWNRIIVLLREFQGLCLDLNHSTPHQSRSMELKW